MLMEEKLRYYGMFVEEKEYYVVCVTVYYGMFVEEEDGFMVCQWKRNDSITWWGRRVA